MKRIKSVLGFVLLSMCILVSCGKPENNISEPEKYNTESENVHAEKMPEIVFLNTISNPEGSYMVTFWDKEGNYYSCEDASICAGPFMELIENFKHSPESFVLHSQKCDIAELESNYQTVCQIGKDDDYDLVQPDSLPAVEASRIRTYGMYFDASGALQAVRLHENQCLTDIYSKDKRANQVYDWYRKSVVIQENIE